MKNAVFYLLVFLTVGTFHLFSRDNADANEHVTKRCIEKGLVKKASQDIKKHLAEPGKPYFVSCTYKIGADGKIVSSKNRVRYLYYRKRPSSYIKNIALDVVSPEIKQIIQVVYNKRKNANTAFVVYKNPFKEHKTLFTKKVELVL